VKDSPVSSLEEGEGEVRARREGEEGMKGLTWTRAFRNKKDDLRED
jgi:hypothetical protein